MASDYQNIGSIGQFCSRMTKPLSDMAFYTVANYGISYSPADCDS